MATQTVSAVGGNWSSSATWLPGSIPAAGDDVVLNSSSGNLTIDVNTVVVRSFICTGFTGTITHNAGVTLNQGGATAPASNIAIVFAGTYTIGNATTSAISIADTSAAINTYNFNGATLGNVTINNGTTTTMKLVTSGFNTGATATVTHTQGGLNLNSLNCSWGFYSSANSNTRALNPGTATITLTGAGGTSLNLSPATNMTYTSSTETWILSGLAPAVAIASNVTFATGSTIAFTGGGGAVIFGNNQFGNITYTGTATKTCSLTILSSRTNTGTLTINGNSATNRVLFGVSLVGSQYTVTSAANSFSNVDFQGITGAGAASWDVHAITGNSGDCGGNSGLMLTSSVQQTWSGTSGGNWSANAWTTRVPLPQDDVVISSAFSASQTITCDMPRLGRSINWTGATGNPTFGFTVTSNTMYGSLTLISGMTYTGSGALTFAPNGSYNLTTAGLTLTNGLTLASGAAGTLTLQGNLVTSSSLTLNAGTFIDNGYTVTSTTVSVTGATLTKTGNWSLTSTSAATVWNCTAGTISDTGTTTITNASTNTRTFAGGSKTYGTLTYTVAGSTGLLIITGSNSFATINFSDASNARTLQLPFGSTNTFGSGFNVNGTSGKLMTVNSSSVGNAAAISYSGTGPINCNYLFIQDSAPAQTNTWFAGNNSTLESNTGNWIAGTSTSTSQSSTSSSTSLSTSTSISSTSSSTSQSTSTSISSTSSSTSTSQSSTSSSISQSTSTSISSTSSSISTTQSTSTSQSSTSSSISTSQSTSTSVSSTSSSTSTTQSTSTSQSSTSSSISTSTSQSSTSSSTSTSQSSTSSSTSHSTSTSQSSTSSSTSQSTSTSQSSTSSSVSTSTSSTSSSSSISTSSTSSSISTTVSFTTSTSSTSTSSTSSSTSSTTTLIDYGFKPRITSHWRLKWR